MPTTYTFSLILAGTITGGGTGDLTITGIPANATKRENAPASGCIALHGVNWTAGAHLVLGFATIAESTTLKIFETNDDAAATLVPISGLAANDSLNGSIFYFAKQ